MLYNYFPIRIREIVKRCMSSFNNIEEIRIRCGQNIVFCTCNDKLFVSSNGTFTHKETDGVKLYKEDLKEMIKYFTKNSVYAMQQDIKNGFITLSDGTRVGLCGRCVIKNGELENINNISSFNIRLSRQIEEWGYNVFDELGVCNKNVLIIAPPGGGKTTLLRNLIKFASDNGENISVVDERSEISPISDGEKVFNMGMNTDVLSDISKGDGINLMLRTMNPDIIAIDEMLTKEDFKVVKNTFLSGVKVFATFHGMSKMDYIEKADSLTEREIPFDCYITISYSKNNERVISYELQEEL